MKKILIKVLGFCLVLNVQAQYIKMDASFYSQALDTIKKVDIYLPSDYFVNEEINYPVIYYLHGGGGSQNEGVQFANHYYVTHAENPLSDSMPAAIFVCADGSFDPYYGSYWVNSKLYGNHEDYIVNDLTTFIESEFRAMPERGFRFITGYSMGGFGSAHMALSNPEKYRACAPMSAAYLTFADTVMHEIKEGLYKENGSYHIQLSAGSVSKFFITLSGAIAPNLEVEPYQCEMLWDTNGNWVDSVWTKWQKFDCSIQVKKLIPENKLNFFLACGNVDDIYCYPPYLQFEDTLNKYGVDFKSVYNEYDHGTVDLEANAQIWQWMDSLIYNSYQAMGVELLPLEKPTVTVYPNPVQSELHISIEDPAISIASLSVYNHLGQLVLKKMESVKSINVSELEAGVYFIRVESPRHITSLRFIKL